VKNNQALFEVTQRFNSICNYFFEMRFAYNYLYLKQYFYFSFYLFEFMSVAIDFTDLLLNFQQKLHFRDIVGLQFSNEAAPDRGWANFCYELTRYCPKIRSKLVSFHRFSFTWTAEKSNSQSEVQADNMRDSSRSSVIMSAFGAFVLNFHDVIMLLC
jgi:hypothetical protein